MPGAELVGAGWLVPGLVDAHTHPGAEQPGEPLDGDVLRAHLGDHAAAGIPAHDALGAASWTAREYLGLPGRLVDGAPADVVLYDADPRKDLDILDHPRAVVLRGRRRR